MESTLALTVDDLRSEVGSFLGYGRGTLAGEGAWDARQTAAIESAVRSGLRQFYYPPPVPDLAPLGYDWSFLKPVASVTLVQGAGSLALPDDFGGFEGVATILSTTNQVSWAVPLVGESQVRQRYAEAPQATGKPLIAALSPLRGTTAERGQRQELAVFPLADQDYTLQFAYYLLPDALTGTLPYAYGGAAHAETLLESCLCVAEERLDDAQTVHKQKFMERLAASISLDRRNKPQTLGYNGDRSDDRWTPRRGRDWQNPVTVNGVTY